MINNNNNNINRFSTLLILSYLIVSISCIFIAIDTQSNLLRYDVPQENFVTLMTKAEIVLPCDESNCSKSDLHAMEIYSSMASATAIQHLDGTTYLLTANHFCHNKFDNFQLPEFLKNEYLKDKNQIDFQFSLRTKNVILKDGEEFSFEVIKQDPENDLCLIISDYKITKKINIAKKMPRIGDTVSTISSPLGFYENGMSLHFIGVFSGCNIANCFFTVPAISGSSGSLIVNRKNRVVGMTQMATLDFKEITIGAGVYKIRKFLELFKEETQIDLL